jgi:hypothetical protein
MIYRGKLNRNKGSSQSADKIQYMGLLVENADAEQIRGRLDLNWLAKRL